MGNKICGKNENQNGVNGVPQTDISQRASRKLANEATDAAKVKNTNPESTSAMANSAATNDPALLESKMRDTEGVNTHANSVD